MRWDKPQRKMVPSLEEGDKGAGREVESQGSFSYHGIVRRRRQQEGGDDEGAGQHSEEQDGTEADVRQDRRVHRTVGKEAYSEPHVFVS